MREPLSRSLSELRGFWGRLGPARRLALVLLAAAFACALVLGGLWSGPGGYQLLVESRAGEGTQELRSLLSLLEASQVAWRSRNRSDGSLIIEVRAGADYKRAIFLAAEHGFASGRGANLDWLYQKSDFGESSEKFRERIEETKRRMIEDAIRCAPNIASASLIVRRAPAPIYAREVARPSSAAVALRLKPGVQRLEAREAATIRDLISGAFNVERENIQITDDRLNSYPHSGAALEGLDFEEQKCRQIRQVVLELYRGRYRPEEFRLGVLVDVSSRASESEDEAAADSEAGPRRRQRASPGAVRGIRVNLVLDIEAVKRKLIHETELLGDARGDLAFSIERYVHREKAFLENQTGAEVTVVAEVFSGHEGAPAAAQLAAAAEAHRPAGLFGVVAAGGLLLLSLVLLLRQRRKTPAAPAEASPAGFSACEETLEAVRAAGKAVAERPEVAAAIVKLWLAQDGEGTSGEQREPTPAQMSPSPA
jgi:flagellar biosynthesis/type III secretory pathway M-ring protein FliF/YscJ